MKTSRIIFLILSFSILLTACVSTKLADSYDENAVVERAKEVVEMINAQDFAAVNAQVRDDLQDKLPAENLQNTLGKTVADAGDFLEYSSTAAIGQKSKSTGEDYATVVLVCKYQNATLTYTITMDANLDIVGLYSK